MNAQPGTVYLVGAGPGAADLLTLRAARLLGEADIVFHDALVNPAALALAVRAERVAVGKRCGRHSTAQRFINKRLVDAARKYRTVVRLKGGDPMLFGRAQEEIDALREAGIACEVVPGITAALAAAADLKIALTRRGVSRSVVFATPRVGEGLAQADWAAPLAHADTAAIYMGARQADPIARALRAHGKPASLPVVAVENASLPDIRVIVTTLGDLPRLDTRRLEGPVMLLVGSCFAARAGACSAEAAPRAHAAG
jgi:uroporphyrin-III C-methyltransferase